MAEAAASSLAVVSPRARRWSSVAYASALAAALPVKIVADSTGVAALWWGPALTLAAAALLAWRERSGSDPSPVDAPRLALVALGLWYLTGVGPRVGGDGLDSFVSARSLLFDQDVDIRNDFQCVGFSAPPTVDGAVKPRFPIGLGVLWMPPLAVTHAGVLVARRLGSPHAADGCSVPYLSAAVSSSFAYGFAGLLLLEWLLRRHYARGIAFLAVLGVWLATPLFFYMVRAPAMSHAATSAVYTVMIALVWSALGERAEAGPRLWLRVGLCAGLLALVRPNDVLHVLFPLALVLGTSRDRLRSAAALLAGPAAALAIQVAWWYSVFGSSFVSTVRRIGRVATGAPEVWEVLFSAQHGLFTWTPLCLMAPIGWLLWWRRNRVWALWCGASFALATIQISTTGDWWGNDSFGQRRLLTLSALFAFGIAEALRALVKRPLLLAAGLLLPVILWTQQFGYVYDSQWVGPRDQPISLAPLVRAQMDLAYRRLLNAAAWMPRGPWVLLNDNLTGIWVDAGGSALRGRLEAGREYDEFPPLFGNGWYAPERDDEGAVRFTQGRHVMLTFPLRRPAGLDFELRLRPLWHPVRVDVEVNGAAAASWKPEPGWSTQHARLPANILRPGLNHVRLALSQEGSGDLQRSTAEGERVRKRAWLAVRWLRFRPAADR